jgi:hypothetical protein
MFAPPYERPVDPHGVLLFNRLAALRYHRSDAHAAAWAARGLRGRYLPVPAHDHFSILEELARPKGAILAALPEMARG